MHELLQAVAQLSAGSEDKPVCTAGESGFHGEGRHAGRTHSGQMPVQRRKILCMKRTSIILATPIVQVGRHPNRRDISLHVLCHHKDAMAWLLLVGVVEEICMRSRRGKNHKCKHSTYCRSRLRSSCAEVKPEFESTMPETL